MTTDIIALMNSITQAGGQFITPLPDRTDNLSANIVDSEGNATDRTVTIIDGQWGAGSNAVSSDPEFLIADLPYPVIQHALFTSFTQAQGGKKLLFAGYPANHNVVVTVVHARNGNTGNVTGVININGVEQTVNSADIEDALDGSAHHTIWNVQTNANGEILLWGWQTSQYLYINAVKIQFEPVVEPEEPAGTDGTSGTSGTDEPSGTDGTSGVVEPYQEFRIVETHQNRVPYIVYWYPEEYSQGQSLPVWVQLGGQGEQIGGGGNETTAWNEAITFGPLKNVYQDENKTYPFVIATLIARYSYSGSENDALAAYNSIFTDPKINGATIAGYSDSAMDAIAFLARDGDVKPQTMIINAPYDNGSSTDIINSGGLDQIDKWFICGSDDSPSRLDGIHTAAIGRNDGARIRKTVWQSNSGHSGLHQVHDDSNTLIATQGDDITPEDNIYTWAMAAFDNENGTSGPIDGGTDGTGTNGEDYGTDGTDGTSGEIDYGTDGTDGTSGVIEPEEPTTSGTDGSEEPTTSGTNGQTETPHQPVLPDFTQLLPCALTEIENVLQNHGDTWFALLTKPTGVISIVYDVAVTENISTYGYDNLVNEYELQINVLCADPSTLLITVEEIKRDLLAATMQCAKDIMFDTQPQVFWDRDLQKFTQTILFTMRIGDI